MTTTAPETEAGKSQGPDAHDFAGPAITVVVPWPNEEAAARVVDDFCAALADARIDVHGDNWTDGTSGP